MREVLDRQFLIGKQAVLTAREDVHQMSLKPGLRVRVFSAETPYASTHSDGLYKASVSPNHAGGNRLVGLERGQDRRVRNRNRP